MPFPLIFADNQSQTEFSQKSVIYLSITHVALSQAVSADGLIEESNESCGWEISLPRGRLLAYCKETT